MRRLYFAYGANLDLHQMTRRCPDAVPVCTATLPEHELVFTGLSQGWHGGVATVQQRWGRRVVGALYVLSRRDWSSLDQYEGFPSLYVRAPCRVVTTRWGEVAANLYIRSRDEACREPSSSYLATIERGYADFGLDLRHLAAALEETRARRSASGDAAP